MLASVRTFTIQGVEARDVNVEVDVRANGLPSFALVGLPDTAVRESRERVRAAIANAGFQFPQSRITASLAPADLRKAGPGFDLALAAALLVASGQLPARILDGAAFAGELSLDGSVRSVAGVLAMAEQARRHGASRLVVAAAGTREALLGVGADDLAPVLVPIERLEQLAAIGTDDQPCAAEFDEAQRPPPAGPDLAELRGQPGLRWALEVAAAGAHGLLILGPPGAGKSLAARRLPSIMPPLNESEARDAMRIASACGRDVERLATTRERPFRAPHHTVSAAGLIGGGSPPRPGEVTLAHRGVLFLDELAEFSRDSLEGLRQPMEDGVVTIARANGAIALPCRFVLVAAANPCPCGRGVDSPSCECPPAAARRYRTKLSAALADRIDIVVRVAQPSANDLGGPPGETSACVRERVISARARANARHGAALANAEVSAAELRRTVALEPEARAGLAAGHHTLGLTGRGFERALRIARTIADLAGSEVVTSEHVAQALVLRRRAAA